MRIAQSQGLLPYPSSILGQPMLSQSALVPWALRGFPQQAVSQFVRRITSHRLYVFTFESSNEVSLERARISKACDFSDLSTQKKSSCHSVWCGTPSRENNSGRIPSAFRFGRRTTDSTTDSRVRDGKRESVKAGVGAWRRRVGGVGGSWPSDGDPQAGSGGIRRAGFRRRGRTPGT